MNYRTLFALCLCLVFWSCGISSAAKESDKDRVLKAMKRATAFMVDEVSREGGYVWNYLPDFSRSWGEMEAFPTMISIQSRGTPGMGSVFLDAYRATGDEFYYEAASETASVLIRVQHPSGGWNYVADLAGEESLRRWYDTIGRNGWRLEEFQHYYGNATFDDGTTIGAARFMLQMYLEKRDPKFKASLDKAIQFVLDAQYKSGGWPQRYPLIGGYEKDGNPDYSGFITFNDDVAISNMNFLKECYEIFGDERLLEPVERAMNSFVITQQPSPQAGWAMQYTPELEPAGARSYEPKALATSTTAQNIEQLIRFYYETGDRKFLARIPEAFEWLDTVANDPENEDLKRTHPTFVELGTNKPLYIHRSGSNARNGKYYADQNPKNVIGHYSSFRDLNVVELRQQYQTAVDTTPEDAMKNSPFDGERPRRRLSGSFIQRVESAIADLNEAGFWPAKIRSSSNRFIGQPGLEVAEGDFAATRVGDKFDTSPYRIAEPLTCISTSAYRNNMRTLIEYIEQNP